MIYGYARVSTKNQERYGNSLDDQEQQLRDAGAEVIYKDACTGTKLDRPQFERLLKEIKNGDTLLVTKLDRFARSFSQGSTICGELIQRGVRVHILNIGIMDNSPSSTLIRNIFFAFASFEKDMILERCASGKERSRQQPGFTEGRPRVYTDEQIALAISLLENNSYRQVEKMTGISKSTLLRARRTQK